MKFQLGKSYLYLFFVFAVCLILVAAPIAIAMRSAVPVFACMAAALSLIVALEFFSGIALDPWWRASRPRSDREYYPTMVWHVSIAVISIVMLAVSFVSKT